MTKNTTRLVFISIVILLLSLFSGCSQTQPVESSTNYVYQVSTLQALIEGGYTGAVTAEELVAHGDTGLGTFDDLDGEMIVLDGVVYKASVDDTITVVDDSETIPFCNVAFLTETAQQEASFENGYDGLKELLDSLYPEENMPVLFCITGEFESITYRSVPEQEEPYPTLTEVVANQAVFEKQTISGTLVGFRFSSYMGDINTSGYHLHFISDDKSFGGHLLDVSAGSITITAQYLNGVELYLPDTISDLDFSASDEDDVEAVEGN